LVITMVLDPGVAQEWEKSDTGVCGIVGIDWTTSQKATKKIPDDNCWRLKKIRKIFFWRERNFRKFFFEGKSVHALTHKTELSPTTQLPNYPTTQKPGKTTHTLNSPT